MWADLKKHVYQDETRIALTEELKSDIKENDLKLFLNCVKKKSSSWELRYLKSLK